MNGWETQGEQGSIKIPFGVFLTFLVCCGLQVGQYVFGWSLGHFVLSPGEVWFNHCFSRLISGAFFHVGLMHFGFNMLSLMTLGPSVEQMMGSLRFVLYMCVCVFLSNIVYVLVCALLAHVHNSSWWNYNSVGYSGCLFAFAAIESFLSPLPTRTLFVFSVPSKWYPWLLLGMMQILMPNISFLGHICGLICGIFYAYGMFEWILPSRQYCDELEKGHPEWFSRWSCRYIFVPYSYTFLTPRIIRLQPPCEGVFNQVRTWFASLQERMGSPHRPMRAGVLAYSAVSTEDAGSSDSEDLV